MGILDHLEVNKMNIYVINLTRQLHNMKSIKKVQKNQKLTQKLQELPVLIQTHAATSEHPRNLDPFHHNNGPLGNQYA